MMISQCDKTKNLALNQQTLWESISLFQLHEITEKYVNNCAAFCRIEKNNVTAILSHFTPLLNPKANDCAVVLWVPCFTKCSQTPPNPDVETEH